MLRKSVTARVWTQVYEAYKDTAEEHSLSVTDLISVLLLAVARFDPLFTAWVIMDAFELTPEEALEVVKTLQENLERTREVAEVIRSIERVGDGGEEKGP